MWSIITQEVWKLPWNTFILPQPNVNSLADDFFTVNPALEMEIVISARKGEMYCTVDLCKVTW